MPRITIAENLSASHLTTTIIELEKEAFHFSAAHFTLFSPTERENLHGHNYQARCRITSTVNEYGLAFDYTVVKQRIKDLCASLDEYTLIPTRSPWLKIDRAKEHVVIEFDGEELHLPNRDVRLLPIANITLESLAEYLGTQLLEQDRASAWPFRELRMGVSSSPGIWAEVAVGK